MILILRLQLRTGMVHTLNRSCETETKSLTSIPFDREIIKKSTEKKFLVYFIVHFRETLDVLDFFIF